MPIKLPKGFQRRKSSGHALDEVHNPPADSSASTFRVLERPASKGKSFDGGLSMKLAAHEGPKPPAKDYFHHYQQEDDVFSHSRQDTNNRYVM